MSNQSAQKIYYFSQHNLFYLLGSAVKGVVELADQFIAIPCWSSFYPKIDVPLPWEVDETRIVSMIISRQLERERERVVCGWR